MFWIIDIGIILVLAGCTFMGYKKGLAKCLIKILSFVIALVVAFILFKPVASLITTKTSVDDNIRSSIIKIIPESEKVDENSDLPKSMIEHINNEIKTNVNETKETVVNTVANEITKTAVNVLAWISIFIVVRIILYVITAIFSVLTELPIIKQIDKIGGVAYGVLQAAVIIFVIFGIISFISPVIDNSGLIATINKSILGSVVYKSYTIMKILF